MMKHSLWVLWLVSLTAVGQVDPAVQGIVDAEKSFAQLSVDKSVKAAFLANFDEQSIAFKGGEPINGRADWLPREENNAYLFWWPVRADVSASGDFGYTTGPAVWGGERQDMKPTGGGYYASVWRKGKSGWKIVADLGSASYNPAENKTALNSPQRPPKSGTKTKNLVKVKADVLTADRNYVDGLNQSRRSFDASYFSQEARLHRPGKTPYTQPEEIKAVTETTKFNFEQVGGDVASSGDMAFTYGRVKATVNRDGTETDLPLSFMRVWKKEGTEWKIVLDVIGG